MAERCAISRLEAPVADTLSLASRSLHRHSEGELLARQDLTTNNVALASLSDVRSGCNTGVVDVEHIVTANEADTASGRPGEGSGVTENPGLNEASIGSNDCTVRNTVTNEDSLRQTGRSLGLESRHNWLRDRCLLLNLLLIQHLFFGLRRWLDVSDGLDRSSGVG